MTPIRSHHLSAVLPVSSELAGRSSAELAALLREAAGRATLTPVAEAGADFEPGGASAVVLLKESHVAAHLWPERQRMTVDIHVCDFSGDNLARALGLARDLGAAAGCEPGDLRWRRSTVEG